MHRWKTVIYCGMIWPLILSCSPAHYFALKNKVRAETIPSKKISLAGSWKFKHSKDAPEKCNSSSFDDSNWEAMNLPSNWYLQGKDYSGKVWFRRHFTPPPLLKHSYTKLVFEGVDYAAEVWLNGQYLGNHRGYFAPFSFPISQILIPGKENVLVVRVDSPYEEPGEVWSLHKTLIKGIFNHHDTRPGGAWSNRGQERNTGGIWNDVYLESSNRLSIDAIKITPKIAHQKEEAQDGLDRNIKVEVSLDIPGKKTYDLNFHFTIRPNNFKSTQPTGVVKRIRKRVRAGKSTHTFNLTCSNTALWWTWDHGNPNLYQLDVTISKRPKRPLLFLKSQWCDSRAKVFGVRSVHLNPESKVLFLNGRRIFVRGTNYISTQWLSEMDREKYALDLLLMKRANINAVRVHAHIERKEFYNQCDELGILVWQDFPLQWGYTEDPEFVQEASKQVKEMVHMLDIHPSIYTWCMHNEPPWDASWMKYLYKNYNPGQNKTLDNALYERMAVLDSNRYTHLLSSTSEHPWLGWYSGNWKDYAKPTKATLISEFGAQALPDLISLRKIFSEKNLWPDTEEKWKEWSFHNFQRKETFKIAKVEMGKNIHEFIQNTQEYQAKLTQLAAESYRRQRFQPVGGIYQFMFVEDWESINWGIVDYWRRPKPGYDALKTAYQPVLPSIEWSKEKIKSYDPLGIKIWIINDLKKEFSDVSLTYSIRNKKRIFLTKTKTLTIPPDSAKVQFILGKHTLPLGRYELVARILETDSHVLGLNKFNFQVIGNQDNESN